MYYEKYCKYKLKYLKLSKQIGGSWKCPNCTFINNDIVNNCNICEYKKDDIVEDNIFYIYTTGIGEWGDLTKASNSWIKFLRQQLLSIIPEKFNINIIHYDPLIYEGDNIHDIDKVIEDINIQVITSDIEIERIKESKFISTILNINNIKRDKPHLLLDLAHIFTYPKYKNIELLIDGNSTLYSDINCVYPGYCGEFQEEFGFSAQYICTSNFIKINENGQVITYIDKLYEHNIKVDKFYPDKSIYNIFSIIRKKIEVLYRGIYENIIEFDDKFNKCAKEITQYIIYLLMNDKLRKENVIEDISQQIIDLYAQKIF